MGLHKCYECGEEESLEADGKTCKWCGFESPLMEKTAPVAEVPCSVGLSAPDQAMEALGRLADYWDEMKMHGEAMSNREYIKVIKGQVICHKLVEEIRGR